MRARSVVLAIAFVAVVGPARAQYPAPLIGGWLLPSEPTAPKPPPGGLGSSEPPQNCATVISGREGPHTRCAPAADTPAPGKK